MVCAPTGVAAVLVKGTTIHRGFGIPSGATINEKTMKIMVRTTPYLYDVDVIIIDEISMCWIDLFDAVSASINKVQEKTGKHIQLIVFGDFFQLPPVLTYKRGEKELLDKYYKRDVGNGYAFSADSWDSFHFVCVELKQVIRQADPVLIANLSKARIGDATCLKYFAKNSSFSPYADGIYLCGHKEQADQINAQALNKLPGYSTTYSMTINGEVETSDLVVSKQIELKPGAVVTTVINDSDGHYVNGSLGTITECGEDHVRVSFSPDNASVYIEFHEWSVYSYKTIKPDNKPEYIEKVCIGNYKQLPVRLAYASTIHKAQGATYNHVNLDPTCWEPGQLYVALSRVRNVGDLHLTAPLIPKYLICDLSVLIFYRSVLQLNREEQRSRGRPKQSYGSSKVIRVSEEISDEVQSMLADWVKIGPERYNYSIMLIPSDMKEKVEKLIAENGNTADPITKP